MSQRIDVDTYVCEGRAVVRGLRITVAFILKLIGDGYTADEIVQLYPELERDDVFAAARYASQMIVESA